MSGSDERIRYSNLERHRTSSNTYFVENVYTDFNNTEKQCFISCINILSGYKRGNSPVQFLAVFLGKSDSSNDIEKTFYSVKSKEDVLDAIRSTNIKIDKTIETMYHTAIVFKSAITDDMQPILWLGYKEMAY